MRKILLMMMCAALIAGCGQGKKNNDDLQDEIDERREALAERQSKELAETESELEAVDTLLERAKREHDEMHAWVMAHHAQMTDRSPEVLRLNSLRAHRDSLQERFNALCYKIKYIKKKQEELANASDWEDKDSEDSEDSEIDAIETIDAIDDEDYGDDD